MSRTINIYNTVNTNKLRTLIDSVYTISWGEVGTPDTELAMPTVYNTNLPYATHTYASDGDYEIEITVTSPWRVEKLKRTISIPIEEFEFPTDFGRMCFEIPYSNPTWYEQQNYLQDYRELTGSTEETIIHFAGVGKSRIDERQLYGSSEYSGVTVLSKMIEGEVITYTAYTINELYYADWPEGVTYISGSTTGSTTTFYQDEIYQGMITRDEHLIGFVDIPQISSDIFVERGKQGVMERNLRLGEIDSTGELDLYGSGFFKVRKQ